MSRGDFSYGQLFLLDECSYLRVFLLTLLVTPFIVSCSANRVSSDEKLEVAINVDWSESGLSSSSEGATCIFYPKAGGAPIKILMGDRNYEKTLLSKGQYDVLVFNRTFGEFGNITFLEEDKFETIKACLKQEYTRSMNLLASPDELAVATCRDWQLDESSVVTLQLTPRKLTRQIRIRLCGEGLENVYSAVGSLTGMPEAVKLADGSITEAVNMQLFNFNKTLTRSEGTVEYTLEATFNAFGFDEELNRELRFQAQLRDGKTLIEQDFGINKVKIEQESGEEIIYIELVSRTLPMVNPGINSGSSFDVAVDKWGDEVNNHIPV